MSKTEQPEKQFKEKVRGKSKIIGCGTCCLIPALIITIVAIIPLYFLAQAGFITLPFFNADIAKNAEPQEIIIPESSSNVSQRLIGELKKAQLANKESIEFSLSQEEVTGLIQETLKSQTEIDTNIADFTRDYTYNRAQVEFENDSMNVFAHFKANGETQENQDLYIRANTNIGINESKLQQIQINSLQIGNLSVPQIMINQLIEPDLENRILRLQNDDSFVSSITNLNIEDNKLNINIDLKSLTQ